MEVLGQGSAEDPAPCLQVAQRLRSFVQALEEGDGQSQAAADGRGVGVAGGDQETGLLAVADLPGHRVQLRVIRGLVDEVLAGMSSEFEAMYASTGRPSIPPERLLRALLLQAFYSIRSERQLMEQLNFTLLFRWFVGLGLDDPVWDASTFSHNRERFLAEEIAHCLLAAIATHRRVRRLLS